MAGGDVRGRRVPEIPREGEQIPLLIDTDAANEVDDQYAIALAIHAPERFDIQGFVATHFADRSDSTRQSAEEIRRVLEHSGMAGRWPIVLGGDPLQYSDVPSGSPGADLIIKTAMRHSPENPLWIAVLGACTNTVSAYLKCPEIAERVVVLFHGRTMHWPETCYNFNVIGDLKAVRVLFTSDLPLVLFDTGTHLNAPVEETQRRLSNCGRIGAYLHEIRTRNDEHTDPRKGFFDLGDIAFLLDPSVTYWEEVSAPSVGWDLRYAWDSDYGRMIRVYQIDRGRTVELFYAKLTAAYLE